VYQPLSASAPSLSRTGDNFGESRGSHPGVMAKARWILPLPEATPGLGQRSHAPLGQSQMFRSLAFYLSKRIERQVKKIAPRRPINSCRPPLNLYNKCAASQASLTFSDANRWSARPLSAWRVRSRIVDLMRRLLHHWTGRFGVPATIDHRSRSRSPADVGRRRNRVDNL